MPRDSTPFAFPIRSLIGAPSGSSDERGPRFAACRLSSTHPPVAARTPAFAEETPSLIADWTPPAGYAIVKLDAGRRIPALHSLKHVTKHVDQRRQATPCGRNGSSNDCRACKIISALPYDRLDGDFYPGQRNRGPADHHLPTPLYEMAGKVSDFLIGAGAFYVLVTVDFISSLPPNRPRDTPDRNPRLPWAFFNIRFCHCAISQRAPRDIAGSGSDLSDRDCPLRRYVRRP